jgi:hypothetical protein
MPSPIVHGGRGRQIYSKIKNPIMPHPSAVNFIFRLNNVPKPLVPNKQDSSEHKVLHKTCLYRLKFKIQADE